MRRYLCVIIVLICTLIPCGTIFAEKNATNIEGAVSDSLDKIDFSVLEDFITNEDVDTSLTDGTFKNYVRGVINGQFTIGFGDVISSIMRHIWHGMGSFFPLIILILSVSILFSIADGLSSKFVNKGTTEIIFFVCYITIIVSVVVTLGILIKDAVHTMRRMTDFMMIVFPILMTLMTALGGVVTVSTYKPMMLILSTTIGEIIAKLIMPIFMATIVFSIVGNLSSNIKLEKMTKSIRSVGTFILGGIFGLFTTFVTIQGITGSAIDNISVKSAKFAISSYVPILGGYLSDGFDIAMASVVLIKNAIGYVGMIVILLISILPVIKIALFILVLRIASGVIEPICDERISSFVYSISENMVLLIAILLGLAFMFFIVCILVILTLNVVI